MCLNIEISRVVAECCQLLRCVFLLGTPWLLYLNASLSHGGIWKPCYAVEFGCTASGPAVIRVAGLVKAALQGLAMPTAEAELGYGLSRH